jgi:hypothetical protein
MAALNGTFNGFFDFVKNRDSLTVCQIGKVISTAIVILDGESRKLLENIKYHYESSSFFVVVNEQETKKKVVSHSATIDPPTRSPLISALSGRR